MVRERPLESRIPRGSGPPSSTSSSRRTVVLVLGVGVAFLVGSIGLFLSAWEPPAESLMADVPGESIVGNTDSLNESTDTGSGLPAPAASREHTDSPSTRIDAVVGTTIARGDKLIADLQRRLATNPPPKVGVDVRRSAADEIHRLRVEITETRQALSAGRR